MEGAFGVALTPRAKTHLAQIQRWWVENRRAAADLFAHEFEAAARRLVSSPRTAAVYRKLNGREIRRTLLPRSRYHIYFELNEVDRLVFIGAIWHVSRGRAPSL
jgi:plasmid stabilization system protein ParE